jgi:hypothetical protein
MSTEQQLKEQKSERSTVKKKFIETRVKEIEKAESHRSQFDFEFSC